MDNAINLDVMNYNDVTGGTFKVNIYFILTQPTNHIMLRIYKVIILEQ